MLVVVEVKSDEEAISLANNCDFGLGSSVWSCNRSRAIAIAGELQVNVQSVVQARQAAGVMLVGKAEDTMLACEGHSVHCQC